MAEETAATECRADRSGVRERCGKICGIGRAGDAVHVRPVVPVQWDSEAHEAIRVLQRIVDRVRPPSIIWFGQRVILAFDQQTKSCRRRARVVAPGLEAEYRAGRCRDLEAYSDRGARDWLIPVRGDVSDAPAVAVLRWLRRRSTV